MTDFEHRQRPSDDDFAAMIAASRATVMEAVRSTKKPWWRRKNRLVVAGATAGILATGSAAYAHGDLASLFFDRAVQQAVEDAQGDSSTPAPRPDMELIADVTLPDGSRFAAWHGETDTLECTADNSDWDGRSGNRGYGGVGCGPPDEKHPDDITVHLGWGGRSSGPDAVPAAWYPVVYGITTGTDIDAVHLTGEFVMTGRKVDLTAPVDTKTRAFSALLPGSTEQPWPSTMKFGPVGVTVEFLDDRGRRVRAPEQLKQLHG